jgi:hypothetical protein
MSLSIVARIVLRSLLFWTLLWAGGWLIATWSPNQLEAFSIIGSVTGSLLALPVGTWIVSCIVLSSAGRRWEILRYLLFWIVVWDGGWLLSFVLAGDTGRNGVFRFAADATLYLFAPPVAVWTVAMILVRAPSRNAAVTQ